MTKFKEYIIEKTNKKEFYNSLINSNIKAGCEFEFYFNGYNRDIKGNIVPTSRDVLRVIGRIENEIKTANTKMKTYFKALKSGDGSKEELIKLYSPIPNHNTLPNYLLLFKMLANTGYQTFGEEEIGKFDSLCKDTFFEKEKNVPSPEVYFNEYSLVDILSNSDETQNKKSIDAKTIMNADFPFSIDGWNIKNDGSLTSSDIGTGVEIVTPIMSLPELIDTIENVFKWIDKNGSTDNTCGFHIHMSLKNNNEIDPLKLILFAEEGLVYKYFANRANSIYAQSVKKGHIDTMEPFTVDNIKQILKKEKVDKEFNTEKHLGIHLVDLKQNHVEFRYMGGSDYHKKFNEIKELTANYAHWLSIACDPEYKKKEYIKKLNRMTNQFNYSYLSDFIDGFNKKVYDDYMYYIINDKKKTANAQKIIDKLLKPYITKLNSLPKPVELIKRGLFASANIIGSVSSLFNTFKKEVDKVNGENTGQSDTRNITSKLIQMMEK